MVETQEITLKISTKNLEQQLIIKQAEVEFLFGDDVVTNIILNNILIDTGPNDWFYIDQTSYNKVKNLLLNSENLKLKSKWEEKETVLLAGDFLTPLQRIKLMANFYVYSEDMQTKILVGQVLNVGCIMNQKQPLIEMFGLEQLNLWFEKNLQELWASTKSKQSCVGSVYKI